MTDEAQIKQLADYLELPIEELASVAKAYPKVIAAAYGWVMLKGQPTTKETP